LPAATIIHVQLASTHRGYALTRVRKGGPVDAPLAARGGFVMLSN